MAAILRFLVMSIYLPAAAASCSLGSVEDCSGHGICVQNHNREFRDPFFNTCKCDICWTGAGDCDQNLCAFFGIPVAVFVLCVCCCMCSRFLCGLGVVMGAMGGARSQQPRQQTAGQLRQPVLAPMESPPMQLAPSRIIFNVKVPQGSPD
eukprot:TRINITY_DN37341_c0_g1_i1.p1 TRINITY_DN37341_c0_g1~~TRINITY_DN37341_c0_g1_i1.p1  ORF type:complete len:171 (+),score=12.99 TRINITY_DN37341_c0_g1_i1:65-514(+)